MTQAEEVRLRQKEKEKERKKLGNIVLLCIDQLNVSYIIR
jgi:hypothetical protein